MSKHANIPVFIPHLGCPNQCVFCNQRSITGVDKFRAESVRQIIDNALATLDADTEKEIAFFGGSFTGIDYGLMCELLEIASSYIADGRVTSIRCSTRPDYIDERILRTLKKYGVKVIELGLQSTDDGVLNATRRSHTFEQEKRACELIVEHGFELVGQMMIGLPLSTPQTEMVTAEFIVSSKAIGARIYPTVVFLDTELCRMTKDGEYTPLSVEEAVKRCANVLKIFLRGGVEVIRIGLCASENLSSEESYYAGPNHSAIGELVINELYYEIIKEKIEQIFTKTPIDAKKRCVVFCKKGSLSKVIGHKRKNKIRIQKEFPNVIFDFAESVDVEEYDIKVGECAY